MSGMSEAEYEKRKNARDFVERKLRECDAAPDYAAETATRVANETDAKQREQKPRKKKD